MLGRDAVPSARKSYWVELPTAPAARTRRTLEVMAELVRDSWRDPYVVMTARTAALERAAPHDKLGQAAGLLDFVRERCDYIEDPIGVEVLATPRRVLEDRCGDCDELTELYLSLCGAVGIPGQFCAVTWKPWDPEWRHVYAELELGRRLVAADPTVAGAPLGWAPGPSFRPMRVRP